MRKTIDINCDLGEGIPGDEAIMPFISSANIACGYHAGDADTIDKTIIQCLLHQVHIGAHPSFDDRLHFGRREMDLVSDEIYDMLSAQIYLIDMAAKKNGGLLHHIKPHGALYNMAARDSNIASVVVQAIKDHDENLILYGLSGSFLISEAHNAGLKTYQEVFADRTYHDNGSLIPRTEKNALIEDQELMLKQVTEFITTQTVTSTTGKIIPILADTICIHGDGKHAAAFAKAIYDELNAREIRLDKPGKG